MKVLFKGSLIFMLLVLFITSCDKEDKQASNVIFEGIKQLNGLWISKGNNYTHSLFFTDDTLTYKLEYTDTTRNVNSFVRIRKGEYFLSSDSVYIVHNVTESTENGEPYSLYLGVNNYIFQLNGQDSLELLSYGLILKRLSGNINELQNSSFYRYIELDGSSGFKRTYYKAVFTDDSLYSYHSSTNDTLYPSVWYKEGPGKKVVINEETFYYPDDPGTVLKYKFSGGNMIYGPTFADRVYVRQE